VNAEDTDEFGGGYRPLHYAAYLGHAELCQLLVQNGAKVRGYGITVKFVCDVW
jgi:ankyrin repeat protein